MCSNQQPEAAPSRRRVYADLVAQSRLPLFAVALTAGSIAFSACSPESDPVPTQEPVAAPSSTSEESNTSEECSNFSQVAEWTLDRRITQVLMGAISTDQGSPAMDLAVQALRDGSVGGINFLGSDASTFATDDLADLVDDSGDLPPLLAVDEEGGRVQRLS